MPPKKASVAKAKATDSKSPAATAASERPRRAATKDAAAPTPVKKAPAKKAATKAAADTTSATKKRGRPAKAEPDDAEPPKKRGRPAKAEAKADSKADATTTQAPKKRGRPAKGTSATPAAEDEPAVPEAETAPPKRRGRPPKGGETTKITEDDPAAAEQLEEELVDAAKAEKKEGSSKRAPPKRGKAGTKGKGRKAKPAADKDEDDVVAGDEGAADSAVEADADAVDGAEGDASAKAFWLMKAEQIDREETLQDGSVFNTKFTIDDLRDKGGPEPWDGVRNPTACKNMREMKAGDLAFFYASGAKGKAVQPGITGIMEIVKEHEPDMSAFDETHPYYVQNPKQRGTKDKPRWSLVHVEFRSKLSKPVGLKELQQYSRDSGVLANMQEFKAARLSVSKVSPAEWKFIVDNLIEGYEDKTEADSNTDDALPVAMTKTKDAKMPHAPTVNGGAPAALVPSSETAAGSIEVNGTSRSGSQKPSSRPTSRAASRAPSRAASRASSRAPSVAGGAKDKLAPPRAQSRGRSRTPASRAGSVKPMQGDAGTMETVEE